MEYSEYQKNIFDWTKNSTGNGAGIAVAGSGKTTTAVDALQLVSRFLNIRGLAFNKHITKVFKEKTVGMRNVEVKTFHAFGWGLVMSQMGKQRFVKLNEDKTFDTLRWKVYPQSWSDEQSKEYYKFRHKIKRLISLFKGECRDCAGFLGFPELGEVTEKCNYHDIDLQENDKLRFYELLETTWKLVTTNEQIADFDDQLYFPIRKCLDVPQSDFCLVDEFQDSNLVRNELMLRGCKSGRKLVIGDPDQSIYGFTGSTPDAMGQFIRNMMAKELPLSICYRCPKAVVREAQKIVPRIEAWDQAKEGVVDRIVTAEYRKMLKMDDLVLCRTTAPLVNHTLVGIRAGRPGYVEGRDIGMSIDELIDQLSNRDDSMDSGLFSSIVNEYQTKRTEELEKFNRQNEILNLEDRLDTIRYLMDDTMCVMDVREKLDRVFPEKLEGKNGICHMTIHKSKGLESKGEGNVFIIRPDLLPHPRVVKSKKEHLLAEEARMEYVADTRAREGLYFVEPSPEEKKR